MTDATQAADDFKTRSATAWTNHDLDTAMSYIADDIVCDTPAGRLEGAEAYRVSRARSCRCSPARK